jgi:hypothetical protein
MVRTTNKSTEAMPAAWLRRKVVQPWEVTPTSMASVLASRPLSRELSNLTRVRSRHRKRLGKQSLQEFDLHSRRSLEHYAFGLRPSSFSRSASREIPRASLPTVSRLPLGLKLAEVNHKM